MRDLTALAEIMAATEEHCPYCRAFGICRREYSGHVHLDVNPKVEFSRSSWDRMGAALAQ